MSESFSKSTNSNDPPICIETYTTNMDTSNIASQITNDLDRISAANAKGSADATVAGSHSGKRKAGRPSKTLIPEPAETDQATKSLLQRVVEKLPGAPPPSPHRSPKSGRKASIQAPEMAKQITEIEKKRMKLIQVVNRYLSDEVIVRALGAAACPLLPPNASLEHAEYVYKSITSTLNNGNSSTRVMLQQSFIQVNNYIYRMMFEYDMPEVYRDLNNQFLENTDQEIREISAELGSFVEMNVWWRFLYKYATFLYMTHRTFQNIKQNKAAQAPVTDDLTNLAL